MTTDSPVPRAVPSLKERQRRERAALILEAAERVLAEKGYHDTSMEEIAARVGIAKGTIYLHYPSKEDLVLALFARELRAFQQLVDEAAAQPGTARARLEAILHRIYGDTQRARQQLLRSLLMSADIPKAAIEQQLDAGGTIAQVMATVRGIVEDGVAAGELDAGISADIIVALFFELLAAPHHLCTLRTPTPAADELAALMARILFHGIAAR